MASLSMDLNMPASEAFSEIQQCVDRDILFQKDFQLMEENQIFHPLERIVVLARSFPYTNR